MGWKLGVISLGPQRTLILFALGDFRSERFLNARTRLIDVEGIRATLCSVHVGCILTIRHGKAFVFFVDEIPSSIVQDLRVPQNICAYDFKACTGSLIWSSLACLGLFVCPTKCNSKESRNPRTDQTYTPESHGVRTT